jgi:carbonic anhydrase/acetyltransferase-like protein (isoleucine patch superfamily)
MSPQVVTATPDHSAFTESALEREEQVKRLSLLLEKASQARHQDPMWVDNNRILRRLLSSEIQTLQGRICRCTCTSRDWSKIYLLVNNDNRHSDTSEVLQRLISDTAFDGVVVLVLDEQDGIPKKQESSLDGGDWEKLPFGIHSNLLISDSILHIVSCRVHRNTIISNTFIGSHTVVANCGHVSTCSTNLAYGELIIDVGPESGGGRTLVLTAESTMIDVCLQLRNGADSKARTLNVVQPFNKLNILSSCSILRDSATIKNVYLHPNSSIHAATSVTNAVLLPDSTIGNSCTASNVLLQWNTSITDNSTISNVLLMEQAHCGPHSVVASTVLGPDVHVSAGEVHASVVGPNTNAHHQSLLIGILWPMGRGNVGYGANVGSNHTGRLPDQEAAVGEGTFWGLSAVIKFPVDLTFSPYSIVAAGANLPPQRVCMPFCLIVGHPTGNEIIPGWVLQSSPYTLARSEKKFATRRKAKRHDFYTGWKIFRPEVIEMCKWARHSLQMGESSSGSTQGIGPNGLTKRGRSIGIRAYTDCIQHYALKGALKWILETKHGYSDERMVHMEFSRRANEATVLVDPMKQVDWPIFPWEVQGSNEWEYQRSLLLEEFPVASPNVEWLIELLQRLVALETSFANRIYKCKKRDDTRGAQTIPGYAAAHFPAESDPVVVEAKSIAKETERTVIEVVDKTRSSIRSKL